MEKLNNKTKQLLKKATLEMIREMKEMQENDLQEIFGLGRLAKDAKKATKGAVAKLSDDVAKKVNYVTSTIADGTKQDIAAIEGMMKKLETEAITKPRIAQIEGRMESLFQKLNRQVQLLNKLKVKLGEDPRTVNSYFISAKNKGAFNVTEDENHPEDEEEIKLMYPEGEIREEVLQEYNRQKNTLKSVAKSLVDAAQKLRVTDAQKDKKDPKLFSQAIELLKDSEENYMNMTDKYKILLKKQIIQKLPVDLQRSLARQRQFNHVDDIFYT